MSCWPTCRSSRRTAAIRAFAVLLAIGCAGWARSAHAREPAAGAALRLVIPKTQAIRIQRAFAEVTPDAAAQPQLQYYQGVNPWAQLLVYAVAAAAANESGRALAASAEEVIVSTDASVGSGVAMGESATAKRFGTQDDANVALRPYAEALKGTTLHGLLARDADALVARGLVLAADEAPEGARQVHVAPTFVFSANQRSVSVDAAVGFGVLDSATPEARRQALRVHVHSGASEALDIADHWLRDDAKELRGTLSALVLSAVEIAAARKDAPSAGAETPERTYRFRNGPENVYIRGKLIDAGCTHVLLQALQGYLVAMPSAAVRDRELLPERCRREG